MAHLDDGQVLDLAHRPQPARQAANAQRLGPSCRPLTPGATHGTQAAPSPRDPAVLRVQRGQVTRVRSD
jgi:hypothetical protein